VPNKSLSNLINRALLAALMSKRLTAAIVDPNDEELMGVANKNEEYRIVEKIVNGEEVDENDPLTIKLLKTWRVFTEETLYCHSYLEL
jgi:hypothetical protein